MQELYFNKVLNFNQLNKKLKVSTNRILSYRLRELVNKGLVSRQVIKEKPINVRYSMTEKGNDLMLIFNTVKQWSVKNKLTYKGCVEKNCNECIASVNHSYK